MVRNVVAEMLVRGWMRNCSSRSCKTKDFAEYQLAQGGPILSSTFLPLKHWRMLLSLLFSRFLFSAHSPLICNDFSFGMYNLDDLDR